MTAVDAGPTADWSVGERKVVRLNERNIVVGLTSKGFFAVNDSCPHQGASLCKGTVDGTMLPSDPQEWEFGRPEEIIRCPWHGWEFDIETGRSLFEPDRIKIRTYDVAVVDDRVLVEM